VLKGGWNYVDVAFWFGLIPTQFLLIPFLTNKHGDVEPRE